MDKKSALKVVGEFREALERRGVRISQIVLYGSYATGSPSEGSDIDLVVISRDFAEKSFWQRISILSDAIADVFQPIEAVAMTPEEWERGDSLIAEFARTGQVVYSATGES